MKIRPLTNDQKEILAEFKQFFESKKNEICQNGSPDDIEADIGTISAYNEITELIDEFINAKAQTCDECPYHNKCVDYNKDIAAHCGMRLTNT